MSISFTLQQMRLIYYRFLVVILLSSGCKPDFDAPCRDKAIQITNKLNNRQLQKFPFGTQDTILFISTQKDTLFFLTSNLSSGFTFRPSIATGNPECPQDVDAFQILQAVLKDSVSLVSFAYTLSKETDSCTIVINSSTFKILISEIDTVNAIFSDSIALPTRTFYKVSTLYNAKGDSILITAQNGLIYFTSGGNSFAQLKFNSK